MGKLFDLKAWLTVGDAARHLSILFGEEVTEADVLRLALDGHLKLSVNFVNHAVAKCGKVIPISEVTTVPRWFSESRKPGEPDNVILALRLNDRDFLELDQKITRLTDVWDLPMIGSEKLDIEHEYQNLTGGPAITLQVLEGAFVKALDGQLCQLQEDFDENEYQAGSKAHLRKLKEYITRDKIDASKARELLDEHKKQRKAFLESRKNTHSGENSENYYPAGGLPHDSVLVVRTDSLRQFEELLNGASASAEKPLATSERNTLLTVIAALCDFSAIKHQERGAASRIAKMTEEMGATVTDDTIRKVLSKIPDALGSRMK